MDKINLNEFVEEYAKYKNFNDVLLGIDKLDDQELKIVRIYIEEEIKKRQNKGN